MYQNSGTPGTLAHGRGAVCQNSGTPTPCAKIPARPARAWGRCATFPAHPACWHTVAGRPARWHAAAGRCAKIPAHPARWHTAAGAVCQNSGTPGTGCGEVCPNSGTAGDVPARLARCSVEACRRAGPAGILAHRVLTTRRRAPKILTHLSAAVCQCANCARILPVCQLCQNLHTEFWQKARL